MTALEEYEIQHIKLTSGDEVISIVSGREGNNTLLEYPMKLNHYMHNENEVYYFTEYMPMSETDIVYLNSDNIVAFSLVQESVKEKYVRACLKSKADSLLESVKEIESESDPDTDLYNMDSPSDKIH